MPNPFAKSRWFHKLANVTGGPQLFRAFPVPRGFALLRVRGRRTGKLRDRPIRAVRNGEGLYAVAIMGKRSDWLRNARKNPEVRVKAVRSESGGLRLFRRAAGGMDDSDERDDRSQARELVRRRGAGGD